MTVIRTALCLSALFALSHPESSFGEEVPRFASLQAMLDGVEGYAGKERVRVVKDLPDAHLGVAPPFDGSLSQEESMIGPKVALARAVYWAFVYTGVNQLRVTCVPNEAGSGEAPKYRRDLTMKVHTNRAQFLKANKEIFGIQSITGLVEHIPGRDAWEWLVDLELVFEEEYDSREVDELLGKINLLDTLLVPGGDVAAAKKAHASIRLTARTGSRGKRSTESDGGEGSGGAGPQRTTSRTVGVEIGLSTASAQAVQANVEWFFFSQDRETKRRSVFSRGKKEVEFSRVRSIEFSAESEPLVNTVSVSQRDGRGRRAQQERRSSRESTRYEGWLVRVVSPEGKIGAIEGSSTQLEALGRKSDLGGLIESE